MVAPGDYSYRDDMSERGQHPDMYPTPSSCEFVHGVYTPSPAPFIDSLSRSVQVSDILLDFPHTRSGAWFSNETPPPQS